MKTPDRFTIWLEMSSYICGVLLGVIVFVAIAGEEYGSAKEAAIFSLCFLQWEQIRVMKLRLKSTNVGGAA